MLDTVVVGGQVVCEGAVISANIGIEGGRIAAIVAPEVPLVAARTIDAAGKLVLPGVIDPHVHYNTKVIEAGNLPGSRYSTAHTFAGQVDDVQSATRSAAFGGVTTVLQFLWSRRGELMSEFLPNAIEDARRLSWVDFAPHGCLYPDLDQVEDIPRAMDLGVTSFKATLAHRLSGLSPDPYIVGKQMRQIRKGGLYMIHAEDGHVVDVLEEELIAAGKVGPEYYLPSRPNVLEQAAVEQLITTADALDCPLYVVHLTSREGLEAIAEAQARGRRVYTETCPHYLLLTDEEMRRQPAKVKICPPLRSADDREAMWKGLRQGIIASVASDHAPFSLAQKERALVGGDIFKVPFGMPAVETMLPLIYSEGVRKGRISLTHLAEVLSTGSAKRFGLYPRKGTIKVGSDADLVIFDPNLEWTIKGEELHSNANWTPYEGWRVVGKQVKSLLRGQLLLDGDRLATGPGAAEYIPRPRANGR